MTSNKRFLDFAMDGKVIRIWGVAGEVQSETSANEVVKNMKEVHHPDYTPPCPSQAIIPETTRKINMGSKVGLLKFFTEKPGELIVKSDDSWTLHVLPFFKVILTDGFNGFQVQFPNLDFEFTSYTYTPQAPLNLDTIAR
jgi:hypothetical protein